MTRSLARELGSRNITVNCVAPGFIDTDMTRALTEEQRSALLARSARSPGKARRGRRAVAFLASPAGDYHRHRAARQRRDVHGVAIRRRIARRRARGDSGKNRLPQGKEQADGKHRTTRAEDHRRDSWVVNETEIKNESSFVDDLGADSLDTVELVMALEEEFETEIPDEEAEKITTVQQAVDFINKSKKP